MVREIDRDGLLLCDLQAKTFELSVDRMGTSSEIFVRRFMKSDVSKLMDSYAILDTNMQADDILDRINEEYGESNYGTVKYTHNEMFWIGYLYRYFSCTYDLSSSQIYKMLKPKELRDLFLPYHTMDTAQAIERILEAKGISFDASAELKRQYAIFKKVREESAKYDPKG